MGMREDALALADELEAFEDGDCEECSLYGQPECKGHLSCMEVMARYAARKIREAVERDGECATTVSAYDLLPDDDRKAIAWVREHGGLGTVEKRLMPEGMEWPRFDDDAPIKFGDEFADGLGNTRKCQSVELLGGDDGVCDAEIRWSEHDCDFMLVCVWQGERVKRPAPKVLDANGEEIREGDVLYSVETGDYVTVDSIEPGNPWFVTTDGALQHCAKFTHRAPVIAADGKPLRVGETVWDVEDRHGYPHTVVSTELDGLGHVKTTSEQPSPASNSIHPSRLTHERPVLDADGNRIEPAMDVWWICEGDELGIHAEKLHVESIGEGGFVECSPFNGGIWWELDSTELYVHKPVLDADGLPIKEGDTVYLLPGEWCDRFPCLWFYGGEELNVIDLNPKYGEIGSIKCCKVGKMTSLCYPQSSQLTHTKPEIDTWERINEDAGKDRCSYFGVKYQDCGRCTQLVTLCSINKSRDLVRRCRALAEKENRNE